MSDLYSKEDYRAVADKPCTCVTCSLCRGTGNIRVDDRSQPEGFDLESCDQCNGGIVEVCDRCILLDEMYQDAQEHEERTQRAGLP